MVDTGSSARAEPLGPGPAGARWHPGGAWLRPTPGPRNWWDLSPEVQARPGWDDQVTLGAFYLRRNHQGDGGTVNFEFGHPKEHYLHADQVLDCRVPLYLDLNIHTCISHFCNTWYCGYAHLSWLKIQVSIYILYCHMYIYIYIYNIYIYIYTHI